MKTAAAKGIAFVFALLVSAALATGCSGSSGTDSSFGADNPSVSGGSSAAATAPVDVSKLKTVGDVLALSENSGYGWNDTTLVCVADGEGLFVRGVATITPEVAKQVEELDVEAEDFTKQQDATYGQLQLDSVEDLSSGIRSQENLDSYVGKTGQDLFDEGFTFYAYNMYGGDTTMAGMEDGYYLYEVTFDAKVPESATEDGGASIANAPITEMVFLGASNAAMSPDDAS